MKERFLIKHKQLPAMKQQWDKFNPFGAMVVGNLDLIVKWFIDPVKASGEGATHKNWQELKVKNIFMGSRTLCRDQPCTGKI